MDPLQPTHQFNRIVTISNHAAEYPPLDLSKMQYQTSTGKKGFTYGTKIKCSEHAQY